MSRPEYRAVRVAIERGHLVRPAACEKCRRVPPLAKDGRSNIHAHHADYSKPLDVEWLCAKCHRAVTPLPINPGGPSFGDANGMRTKPHRRVKGERNGFAKLTEAAARDILLREQTPAQYAAKHGVDRATIYDVLRGRTWSWLTAAPDPFAPEPEA